MPTFSLVFFLALTFSPNELNATGSDLPVVVLIGDSIRLGYANEVAQLLEGTATVESPKPNGGDSRNVLANLDDWVIAVDPAVVHLNAGLHDLRFDRDSQSHQVGLDQYRKNLDQILGRIESETGATIILATTTPVIEERHNTVKPFDRFNEDIDLYNEVIKEVQQKHPNVILNDLHKSATLLGLDEALVADGVHFTRNASKALARRVASAVEEVITESP